MLFGAAVHQLSTFFAQPLHGKGWAGAVALQPLQQAPAHEGAQDASAQICLHLGHSGLIDRTGRVKDDARHLLKHPIDRAHMEVHMPVQTGAEPVDEGDCADMQSCLAHVRCTGAVGR